MASLPEAVPPGGPAARPAPPAIRRVRRRRRPSGEPPPLPRHLNASGKWWLALRGAVVVGWGVIWAPGSVSVFDIADTRVLQAFARIRTPGLTRAALAAGGRGAPGAG